MKYPHITAQAPKAEFFDPETFVTNEAGWITTGHLDGIESRLAAAEVSETAAQARIATLETEALISAGLLTAANDTIAQNVTAAQQQADRITALEAENEVLGAAAAGTFTQTVKDGQDVIAGATDDSLAFLTSVDAEKARMNKTWAGPAAR